MIKILDIIGFLERSDLVISSQKTHDLHGKEEVTSSSLVGSSSHERCNDGV